MSQDPARPVPTSMKWLRQLVRTARRMRARLLLGRRAHIAGDAVIGARARWLTRGDVQIDDSVFIGADFFCETGLQVGPHVLISSRVAFVGDDHPFDGTSTTITDHPRRPTATVVLRGDNLIGHGTIIVGPAVIGRGTIVGAGSLVVGDLPGDSVCIGRPARVVRSRRLQPP